MFLIKNKKIFLLFFVLIALMPIVFSADLPPGLIKLLEVQNQQVESMNYLIAFAGGIIALLSPCILSILPAFLAVAFKERKNLAKMFGIFFISVGFTLTLFTLGGLGFGRWLRIYRFEIALFVGFILLAWAVMLFLGKRIFKLDKDGNDPWGILMFGVLFAIGYTPCVFPVSAAITVIGNTPLGTFSAIIYNFLYIAGLFLPMMLIAVLYDRFKLSRVKLMNKSLSIGPINLKISDILAALLFVFFGLMFILYRGTYVFNAVDPAESMVLVNFGQSWLLNLGIPKIIGNVVGIIIIALFGYGYYKILKKLKESGGKEKKIL